MELEQYHCIAVVGGGGKTSLLFYLAGRFVARGKRVIVATSTHMADMPEHPFALWQERETIEENLERYGYTVAGVPAGQPGKITCPSDGDFGWLQSLCDVLLIEADGAKRLPLKVPAAHEPVIPLEAELVIGVVGLDALGQKIGKICHRPELTAAYLGKDQEAVILSGDVAAICAGEAGLRKQVGDRAYKVVLNKADNEALRTAAKQIRQQILQALPGQKELEVEILSLRRKKLGIVLLAAGNSHRFGPENKLLYPVEGTSLFERTLRVMKRLNCGEIAVVTQYEEIAALARANGCEVFWQEHSERGISSSIQLGILGLPSAKGWLISVCDQPYLTLEALEGLLSVYFSGGERLAAMALKGEPGNPAIFSQAYKEELLALTGDRGGRKILSKHQEELALYEVTDPRVLMDVDVPLP